MKHTFTLITALLAGGSLLSAMEPGLDGYDSVKNDKGGYHLIITRTSPQDKKILEATKPKGPHEIPVPAFVVKSQNNKFLMTIGGQINTILGWDLGNNLYQQDDAGINFVTQCIPVPSTPGHRSDFFINPFNAAMDFQIVGLAGTENEITGYFKIATNGNNHNLNLSKAYVTWRGFTAGLKHTLMMDGDACQPPTIDPQGPCGCLAATVGEVSYTSKNYNGFKFAIGLDMPTWCSSNGIYRGKDFPKFDGTQVSNYGDAEQVVPDIPMWIQYGKSDNNRVRLSGMIRNFAYRDLLTDKIKHKVGWGVMLSGNVQPWSSLLLYYQLAYGQGIGNYLQDISGLPLSFIPENAHPGKMQASSMMGVNIGASVNITKKLQFNIMASESRIWDVEDYAIQSDATNYKYALYGAANLFYNVTSYLQFGVEYLYGKRLTWNIGSGHDNRIQTQVMFTL